MKKPKMKKLPKRPKASAGAETWKKYEKKVADITKENKAKISKFESDKKTIQRIRQKAV